MGDWFIPLYPGTDTALALGVMNVLFAQGLTDDEFLHRYTVGHEELREHVKTYTPERVSRITGVPEADIIRLAEMYGTARAAYINIGNGLQHHDNGGMNVRAVTCLPALTGQWLKHGGERHAPTALMPRLTAPIWSVLICDRTRMPG